MSASHSFDWKRIFSRPMLICMGTGFSSGLPLYVLIQLLPTWLRDHNVDLKTIGLFSLTSLPYVWKFLWAPLLDIPPKFSGLPRRKGWGLLSQSVLLFSMIALTFLSPVNNVQEIAFLAVVLAFASASQDAVLDAHRRELLSDEELGLGSSFFVNAYRISSLVPGSLALFLADQYSWRAGLWSVIVAIVLIMFYTLWIPEPQVESTTSRPNAKDIFGAPLTEFIHRLGLKQLGIILTFMLFYKLGDSMATSLASAFYLDLGFSKTELAGTVKVASLWSSITGGVLGGIWMLKIGVRRALWIFGWFQLLTILGFAVLAWDSTVLTLRSQFPDLTGVELVAQSNTLFGEPLTPNRLLLFLVVSAEYLGVGLGTAAFVAFIATQTNKRYSAAQFALLTSLSGLPRTLASATSGWIVESVGYTTFFLFCTALAFPGMILLRWIPEERKQEETPDLPDTTKE